MAVPCEGVLHVSVEEGDTEREGEEGRGCTAARQEGLLTVALI